MTKLYSFAILALLLSVGQTGCGESDADKTQGAAQSGDSERDSENDATSKSGGAAGKAERESDSLPTDGGAAGGGDTSAGQAGSGAADAAQPGTFSHIYEVAFKSCRTQCHGMGYSMLDMKTRDMAYSQLVDHDTNPGNMKCAPLMLKRVKPGSPDESLLYLKLDIHAPCGQQMPPGGVLMQSYKDEIRDWIMNGAKDD